MLDIIEQLPGYVAWKDSHRRYLGCNRNLTVFHGFKYPEQIVGLTDEELGHATEDALEFFHESDSLALSGKTIKVIHTIGSPLSTKSFLLEKKPLFNHERQIMGAIYQCQELNDDFIFLLQRYDAKQRPKSSVMSYNIGVLHNPYELSAREIECLFLVLRGMTAKKMADILGLSKRTIEFYIANIKNKMGCMNKAELMALSIRHGYMDVIPPRFANAELAKFFC